MSWNQQGKKNILDLLITSERQTVEGLIIGEQIGTSDHNSVIWDLVCSIRISGNKPDRNNMKMYHRGDYDAMRKWFGNIDWEKDMNNKDIDGMWDYFCAKISNAVELFVPTNSKKRAKLPKWINKASHLACKAKANKWKVYRNSRTFSRKRLI